MSASFTWSTPNTKEAACFCALGFTYSLDVSDNVVNDDLTGETMVQWIIHDTNVINPALRLNPLLSAWQQRQIPHTHPMRMGYRACLNFESLRQNQATGQRLRLTPIAGDGAFQLVPGDEPPAMRAEENRLHLSDFNLAAALTTIGIPIIDIFGPAGSRVYVMPRYGHPRLSGGQWVTEDAVALARRQPGSHDLMLESTAPDHPLVHAYNALHCWAQLRAALKNHRKHLIVQFPQWTQRRAVMSETATPRVVDRLRKHLRLPKSI